MAALLAVCWALPCLADHLAEDPDHVGSDRHTISADDIPEDAVIGRLVFERQNVFNLDDPKENNAFYRFLNRWHIVSRESLIRRQLVIAEGDRFDPLRLSESERILRDTRYLWDANVRPIAVDGNKVDVEVATRDVWTLMPDISLGRSGGENTTKIGLEENNLFGGGQLVRLARLDNVDRSVLSLEFVDNNITDDRWSLYSRYADNSDGRSNEVRFQRPFINLDSRWTAGTTALDQSRITELYRLGDAVADFREDRQHFVLFGGRSRGLVNGKAKRFTAGIVYDDRKFSQVSDSSLDPAIPEDRKFVYPYLGYEYVEDSFATESNRNLIGRTEDFYVGLRYAATIGWSDESFGADRDALLYSFIIGDSFGSMDSRILFLDLFGSGRNESGKTANAQATGRARFYWHWADKRTFFITMSGTAGHNLDLDNPVQLGGDSGLRGYPLRYQTGDSRFLFTIEQRFFTDWYPFRFFRVGGAVFADLGRTWGENPVGEENLGWLRDVGFGLRLAPTRASTSKMIHIDVAFPLDGDDSIDSVQILLEAKRSF